MAPMLQIISLLLLPLIPLVPSERMMDGSSFTCGLQVESWGPGTTVMDTTLC